MAFWRAISTVYDYHTCGLTTTGAVYCWGEGTSGKLGNGSLTNSLTPVKVSDISNFAFLERYFPAAGADWIELGATVKAYALAGRCERSESIPSVCIASQV